MVVFSFVFAVTVLASYVFPSKRLQDISSRIDYFSYSDVTVNTIVFQRLTGACARTDRAFFLMTDY